MVFQNTSGIRPGMASIVEIYPEVKKIFILMQNELVFMLFDH